MAQQWLHVQELVDLTIDFFHDSLAELKHCSLVCHSWLPAARYHLFSCFSLEGGPAHQHLINILSADEFRHIWRLITHFAIAGSPSLVHTPYNLVSKMYSPHLKQLSIYTLPSTETMTILQDLIALPNITHISVLQTQDQDLLPSFFSKRTSNLGTLRLASRSYIDERDMDLQATPAILPPFQIDCLRIPAHFQLRRGVVFDLSALRGLIIDEYAELISFERIIRDFESSLTYLEIAGLLADRPGSANFERKTDIGLHALVRLEHFTLHIDLPNTLTAIPNLLSKIEPSGCLRQVTLVVSRDCAPYADLADFDQVDVWNAIDQSIAPLGSVSLTVRVDLSFGGALESHIGVEELRGCLPRLASARRLLVVAFS